MEINLGHSDKKKQQQEELSPLGYNLALRDIALVTDDLVLDAAPVPQLYSKFTEPKQSSYTVELFWDDALVTATELFYGKAIYPLENIDSLQILRLNQRRSIFQKKLSNFLAKTIATVGLILLFGPVAWSVHLLGLILAVGSVGYAVYFNWWVEQRRQGEFGLLMTTKLDAKVVITSHNLKAIQSLYQIIFGRLGGDNLAAEPLVINMYTGKTVSYR